MVSVIFLLIHIYNIVFFVFSKRQHIMQSLWDYILFQRDIGIILPSRRDSTLHLRDILVFYSHCGMLHMLTSYFDNKYWRLSQLQTELSFLSTVVNPSFVCNDYLDDLRSAVKYDCSRFPACGKKKPAVRLNVVMMCFLN